MPTRRECQILSFKQFLYFKCYIEMDLVFLVKYTYIVGLSNKFAFNFVIKIEN